jgi:plasmid stability protein
MPTLQVRDLPPEIYRRLAEVAAREHRSLAQQTIALLAQSLGIETSAKERRRQCLAEIAQSGVRLEHKGKWAVENTIREDRNR